MQRCSAIADCTEEPGRITRRCLTGPMVQAHERLSAWMRDAGLDPHADHAGNLIGRRTTSKDSARVLLIGSHLDSVPGAGRYDGVLGVLMGLAAVEALRDANLPFEIHVIGFSEEEGVRFSMPYLGSSAVAGCFQSEWFERTDPAGVCLRDALTQFGAEPGRIDQAAYSADRVIGYLEPHLEQGPTLERLKQPLGVVSGIVGQTRLRIELRGEAGHAGTTPMEGRCDALVAAAQVVTAVRDIARRTEGLRATVGRIENSPNAPNVIPDRVVLSLDVRHPLDGPREAAIGAMVAEAGRVAKAEGCGMQLYEDSAQDAVAVNEPLTNQLADAIAACGCKPHRVPSGAGHDAVVMAKRFPVAMLFLRHPGAVSHHPDERVDTEDVATGIEAMTRFVLNLAKQDQSTATLSST
ncbi:Hydantoin utilization protein C [Planctomycetes bacterium MalM25]|nr:Hydantoin utilization protein C [Planctomycetes bacterium MalM25]